MYIESERRKEMLKRLCDYCGKEIRTGSDECKIFVQTKNSCSRDLDTLQKELEDLDFCEKCVGEIYGFILKGKGN